MTKLRLTLVIEYEADPDMYGTADAAEMAALDREAGDPFTMVECLEHLHSSGVVQYAIEPVAEAQCRCPKGMGCGHA